MYKDLHFYIYFDWETYIELGDQYFTAILQMVEFAYMHKASVFYFEEQLQEFTSNLSDLDTDFVHSKGNKLSIILRNAKARKKNKYTFDITFNHEHTSLQHRPLLGITPNEQIAVLSPKPDCCSNYLLTIKNKNEINLLAVNILCRDKDILSWISGVIPKVFHKSDKHGEYGKGNWHGESCLLCSSEKAQSLLNTSIPDLEEIENRLFNYDPEYKTFIEFFYEGDNPQQQWHGFHLKQEDWKRVPARVKTYLSQMR